LVRQIVNGESLQLRQGDVLVLSRAGYHETTLTAGDTTQRAYTIALRAVPVPVRFDLSSETGITINGGRKVDTVESLLPGSYRLSCTRAGYPACETTLKIVPGSPVAFVPAFSQKQVVAQTTTTAKVPSTQQSGGSVTVRFVSKPPSRIYGAEIFINGRSTGKTVPDKFIDIERGKDYEVQLVCRDGTKSVPRKLREIQQASRSDFKYSESDFTFK
jgi:hypothetical protein